MPLSAYFFAGLATYPKVLPAFRRYGSASRAMQEWDSCKSAVVFGRSLEDAQKQFEMSLRQGAEGENSQIVIFHKISGVPFADRLLTESGNVLLDWRGILSQMEALLESTPMDDFEQGYWVDVDQVVRPEKLSFSAGTLELSLPEEVRSGLNWSPDKKFFFVVSALTPPPLPSPKPVAADAAVETDESDNDEQAKVESLCNTYPMACDKDAVALVQARNSVIAAWLWRTYASKTPLAARPIRIDPWPGVLGTPGN